MNREARERIRRQAEQIRADKAASAQAVAVAPPKSARLKPAVVGAEVVRCPCGHDAVFEHFAEKQDRNRDARRKKLAGRPCPACRQERHARLLAEAAEHKRRRSPKMPRQFFRLPHGSFIGMTYDAERGRWTGSLTVPPGALFEAEHGSADRLQRTLGQRWFDGLDAAGREAAVEAAARLFAQK